MSEFASGEVLCSNGVTAGGEPARESDRGGEHMEQYIEAFNAIMSLACENCQATDKKFTNANEYANGLYGFICEDCDQ